MMYLWFIAVVGSLKGLVQKLEFPIPRVCPTRDTYLYYYIAMMLFALS